MLAVAAMLLTAAFGCRNAYDGEDPQSSGKRPAQTDSPPDVSSAPPKIIFTPVESAAPGFYDGYTFRVLEKTDGADSLTADDAQDMIAKAEEERGAKIDVYKRQLDAAGIAADSIRAVFITHEHSDHISALRVFTKKYRVPVYAAAGTADTVSPPVSYTHLDVYKRQHRHRQSKQIPVSLRIF